MRQALPGRPADAATLKPRFQREQDGRQTPRLQRLSLWASGPAQTRQAAARLLSVHRHTVAPGRASDAAHGLDALLDLSVPAGTPLSLPPDVLAAMAPARRPPPGLASDAALRHWVPQTSPRDLN